VQAELDVQTSAVCIAVLWFGLDGILLGFYFYFFIGLQFRAGQTTMPCLHKALFVVVVTSTPLVCGMRFGDAAD